MSTQTQEMIVAPRGAVGTFADRHKMDAVAMERTLMATIMPNKQATREQVAALCIVANHYELDPWLKQIFAFPDRNGGIIPVVGIDGWSALVNRQQQYDGCEFTYVESDKGDLLAIDCTMWRKDRTHPTQVREWMIECNKGSPAWKSNPRRLLRHRAYVQCARIAFGMSGIYEETEGQEIADVEHADAASTVEKPTLKTLTRQLSKAPAPAEPAFDDPLDVSGHQEPLVIDNAAEDAKIEAEARARETKEADEVFSRPKGKASQRNLTDPG